LLVGRLGAGVLAVPAYGAAIAGALLLWCSCILDGCDGEVARLQLLSTPGGARFDAITDNVVHVAVFLALPVHLHLSHAHAAVIPAGLVLIAGVLLSMASVWWLILRQPSPRRGAGGQHRVGERVDRRTGGGRSRAERARMEVGLRSPAGSGRAAAPSRRPAGRWRRDQLPDAERHARGRSGPNGDAESQPRDG